MAHNAATTLSSDYGIMNDKVERIDDDDARKHLETIPILVGKDWKTGTIMAHDVHKKGCSDRDPVHCLKSDLEDAGYIGGKVVMRSGQGPSRIDIHRKVGRTRGPGTETVLARSEVGESNRTTHAESSIKIVVCQIRVLT